MAMGRLQTTTASIRQSKCVETTLNYHLAPKHGGKKEFWLGTVGERRRPHHPVQVPIEDIRGYEEDFKLDLQGFQVVSSPSAESTFDDEERIKNAYYAECIELLKRETGATWAKVMGHTLRKKSWDEALEREKDLPDMHPVTSPTNARFVHVDQSYDGAKERIPIYLSQEEQETASNCRWAIVNVWRPLEAVKRDNLGVCDARSVSDDELRECIVKFSKKGTDQKDVNGTLAGSAAQRTNGESGKDYRNAYLGKQDNQLWEVVPPKEERQHRWYYASGLKPKEALLLKIFDTKLDGTARRSPHSAFTSPEDTGPPRQSIEVRCFVMWQDQAAT